MNQFKTFVFLFFILFTLYLNPVYTQKKPPPVSTGSEGKLEYISDSLGNRVPDYSYCGYMASNKPIPDVSAKIVVPITDEDATRHIQSAIDYLTSLPVDKNGFRGAVLLQKGTYRLSGRLKISASGIVLRGSGIDEDGTTILADGKDRQTLIRIAGIHNQTTEEPLRIVDEYVPVNAVSFTIENPGNLKNGDRIIICRNSNKEWIDAMDMHNFGGKTDWIGWKPGQRNTYWDRQIVNIRGNTITIDVPLTAAIENRFGGGTIQKYVWEGRISNIGIENLQLTSTYDTGNTKDEEHCWMAITVENTADAWIRQVVFRHFVGSAVAVYETAKQVTVEDCISMSPVSEIGGQRRYTFFTEGQQTLFQSCYAEYGYHDFAVGFCAPGPNAFVQCESHLPYSFSGAVDSWNTGVLFDIMNVDGQALSFKNRGMEEQGAGWTAANSMLWECSASRIDCFKPPTARNWAFGAWAQFAGNGYWYKANSHVKPRSFYYAQLADRNGNPDGKSILMPFDSNSTSSPSVELAMQLTGEAAKPVLLLKDWILSASERNPLPIDETGIKTINEIKNKHKSVLITNITTEITNGWLVHNGSVITGGRTNNQWWRGNIRSYNRGKSSPHITRYVPGRNAIGLTDNLDEVTNWMQHNNITVFDHNYGLWYERRRDDHERVRRMDGEVWPPFYELPFARSGQGLAWDGLSKYDLTKYNNWYWNRLKEFVHLSDQKGLVLMHQNYFQHNILEAGAHWADSPWRSANNINNTGFPEPPPYAGDKRIFMAEMFYDTTNIVRNSLHRAYIRQCLNNFIDNQGVIQLISEEFSGPLHFVQFWLDVINKWETETTNNALVGLSTTKDVQDAVLNDPEHAATVDLIDIRYWFYRDDGSAYAPEGGKNLAPRQHERLVKKGKASFEQVYRAVSEYRMKFPRKAVIYSASKYPELGWAVFIAGGSLAEIPQIEAIGFLENAATMQPVKYKELPVDQWALSNPGKEHIILCKYARKIKINLQGTKNRYIATWIDPLSGKTIKNSKTVKGGQIIELQKPTDSMILVWLRKK